MIKITEDYYFGSDSVNFVIMQKNITKDGVNKGKEYFTTIGYYRTIAQVFQACLDKSISLAKANALRNFLTLTRKL